MKGLFVIIGFVFCLQSCMKGDHYSPDINDPSLLPDRGDYTNEDYGTQALAVEIAGSYNSEIGLIYYDAETRTIPQLYLTRGPQTIHIDTLGSGAANVHFNKFNTAFMPLELSVNIKVLLNASSDTIYLRGTDGMVRTSGEDMPIGTGFPESDDGELIGAYARHTGELKLFIDPMLPVPVKLSAEGKKSEQ
ncbi:MAG: hypothetical protein QM594_11225 [Niabella sp.]